jgi:hypothetical protein
MKHGSAGYAPCKMSSAVRMFPEAERFCIGPSSRTIQASRLPGNRSKSRSISSVLGTGRRTIRISVIPWVSAKFSVAFSKPAVDTIVPFVLALPI